MVRFLQKVKEFATGKTEAERTYLAEENKKIREMSLKAEVEERKIQNVRLAREGIRAKADARIKAIRNPKPYFSGFGNYGSPFIQPRQLPARRAIRQPVRRSAPSSQRYDILGNSKSNGFRII